MRRIVGNLDDHFLTVDTALLRRYYVLFFIHIPTRQVFYAGATANPTGAWTTQAARNLFLRYSDRLAGSRALAFDEIFATEGLKVLKTPVRTPVANAVRPDATDSSTSTETLPDQPRPNTRPPQGEPSTSPFWTHILDRMSIT